MPQYTPSIRSYVPEISGFEPDEPEFNVEREPDTFAKRHPYVSRILFGPSDEDYKDKYGNPTNIDDEGRKRELIAPNFGQEFMDLGRKIGEKTGLYGGLDTLGKKVNEFASTVAPVNMPGLLITLPEAIRGAGFAATSIPRMILESPPIPKFPVTKPGPITDPRRLLTTQAGPDAIPGTRFFSGEQGIADARSPNFIDTGQQVPTFPREATITPAEFGQRSEVTPDIAANYGGSLGRPQTQQTADEAFAEMMRNKKPQPNRTQAPPLVESVAFNEDKPVTRRLEVPKEVEQTPLSEGELAAADKTREALRLRKPVLEPEKVKAVLDSPTIAPEVKTGLGKLLDKLRGDSNTPSSGRTSIYTQLENIAGRPLVDKAQRAVHYYRRLNTEFVSPYIKAVNQLTKDELANMGNYVEGKMAIHNDRIQNAVETWRKMESGLSTIAEQVGLRQYEGKKQVPFKRIEENYWPRIATPEAKEAFIAKSKLAGMTDAEAAESLKRYLKSGERISGFQRTRRDIPFEYKTDAHAGVMHLRDLANNIAQHVEFGPLDIAGEGKEGVLDLIRATKNPQLATQLMQRIVGRTEFSLPRLNENLGWAKKFSALTGLQNFTLPNVFLGQVSNATQAASHPVEVAKELRNLFSKTYRDDLRAAGLFEDVVYTLGEDMHTGMGKMKDPLQIGTGETINRFVAGAIGKAVARAHFNAIKAGNVGKNGEFVKELGRLLSTEDLTSVLKQSELSPEQLQHAAGRAAERTQGLNVPGNLPYSWSDPLKTNKDLVFETTLIFKKMAFQNLKFMGDMIKTNPKRNIPIILGVGEAMGLLTGGSKSAIKGAWKGDAKGEWDKRDDWVAKIIGKDHLDSLARNTGIQPWVITRALDNISQAAVLGLPADIMTGAATGPTGAISSVAGPILGKASEVAYGVTKIPTDRGKTLAKTAVKSLPIPGSSGIADRIFDSERAKRFFDAP